MSSWAAIYRAGTGKSVEIVVTALSQTHANFLVRMELAKKFKGKTFKVIQRPRKIKGQSRAKN